MSVGELERTEQFRGEPAEAPARRSGWVGNTLGWLWRLGVGALLCTNYLTSVLVVGWLTRRARAGAVRVWWRAGPGPGKGETFEEFCDRQGPDGPSLRPRWLLHQRPDAVLHAPGSDGEKPSGGRVLLRLPRALAGSAAENAVAGVRVLFGTVLLMGWGVLLLQLAWEFGWLNSFTKGYERHFYGAQMGLIAHALFALAMIYVPMAQAHCAATGELRAFLDFRFLSALIRARMTGSVLLAACTLLAALPLMILTVAPQFFNQMNPRFEYATDEQVLQFMRRYVLAHALVLFVALVILRQWAARLYASAVLKVVRRGRVRPGELHPAVAGWLRRTGADLGGQAGRGGVLGAAKAGGGWLGRRAGYVLLFLIWAAFLFLVMVSEFFNYHPWYGFLNQPLIQLPCVDFIPGHLRGST